MPPPRPARARPAQSAAVDGSRPSTTPNFVPERRRQTGDGQALEVGAGHVNAIRSLKRAQGWSVGSGSGVDKHMAALQAAKQRGAATYSKATQLRKVAK